MISAQCFHVFHFEGFHEQIFQSQQGESVFDLEAQHKSSDEICRFLETRIVHIAAGCLVFRLSDLHLLRPDVVSDLELQLLNDGAENLQPVLLQRRYSEIKTMRTFSVLIYVDLTC